MPSFIMLGVMDTVTNTISSAKGSKPLGRVAEQLIIGGQRRKL
jgi:hypothetical protein